MDVPDAERGSRFFTDRASNASSGISSSIRELPNVISQSSTGCSVPPQVPSSTPQEKDNIQRRIKSFNGRVGNALTLPIQLAIAGFIYLGPDDKVQCENCKVKLYNWTKDMVPLEEHRKNSPNCGFLKKWFPIKPLNATASTPANGFNTARAKYQEQKELAKRLSTFEAWPLKHEIHSPQNMALAGFFYIGTADRARCFYCGLTLRDWDTDDDPFLAHLQWSPKCEYINHVNKSRVNRETKPSPLLSNREEPEEGSISPSLSSSTHADECYKTPDVTEAATGSCSSSPDSTKWKYSPQFEAVMAMGFQPELIQKAIDNRIGTSGTEFPDVKSLFLAVEELASA